MAFVKNAVFVSLFGWLLLNLTPISTAFLQEEPSLEDALELLFEPQDKKAPEDDERDDPAAEVVTLEITVGQRPASVYNAKGFVPNEPLTLEGKAADPNTLRTAVVKGIEFILKEQGQDGSWKFNAKTQLRKGVKNNGFLGTASQSMNRVVLTSLCCMALRRHEELDPERIRPAVEKGLTYVIQKAPAHSKGRFTSYAPWTWAFSLTFLCEEFKRTKDPTLQADIKTAAKGVVQLLLEGQHKKQFTPRAVAKSSKKSTEQKNKSTSTKEPVKRSSNGGYFSIVPAENDDVGKEGVLIQSVVADGPAGKGGMKNGDRIVEADGEEIEDLDQLLELIDSFKPGQVVKVKVLRSKQPAKKEKKTMIMDESEDKEFELQQDRRRRQQGSRSRPAPEDGGWSYYTMGSVSFTTATCVLSLLDAREIGVEVPQEALDRAISVLVGLKMQREESDENGFAYHTGIRPTTGRGADIRGSVGRLAVCGMALVRVGKQTIAELAKALEIFVKRRGELDKVRGYPGNHFVRSFMNAAYYYLYAHYYSAAASNRLPDAAQRKKIQATIQEALLKTRNEEGLWTDHEMWGQLYGSAMALMGLGELKELAPTVYKESPKTLPEIKTGEKK